MVDPLAADRFAIEEEELAQTFRQRLSSPFRLASLLAIHHDLLS